MSYYVPWAYPKFVTDYYSRMVDSFVDNVILVAEFREQFGSFQYGEYSTTSGRPKVDWRVGVENARAINNSIREALIVTLIIHISGG